MIRCSRFVMVLVAAASLAAGCTSKKSDTDERVAKLEQQLAETQKQLAAEKAETATPPAQPERASPPPAAPAAAARGQQTADQYATDKATAKRVVEQEKSINAQQAETNAQLQQQVEQLKPREYTLPVGTVIPVRTTGELSTSKLSNGSTFDALLERDLSSGGTVLAKAGTHVTGVVVSSDPGGRVKGTASLSVAVRSLVGVKGAVIAVKTDSYASEAESTKKKDVTRTGVATGVGAIIGGIAGGGKGAAIGAGAGAAAGVGTAMATRGDAAVIPAESLLEFRLTSPATVVMQPQ